jgi:tetratricopeptide (TPR) repeat protein
MKQRKNKRKGTTGIVWIILLMGMLRLWGQEAEGNNDYQYALIEAVKQKNLGNLAEAVKLYKLVIQNKPDCDAAYYELGTIYIMTNQLELAEDHLASAFEMDPDNEWYTLAYLNALGGTESYDRMIDILHEKIRKEPDEVEWEFQLANVLFSQGKMRKSLQILEKIEDERGFSEKVTLLKASVYEGEEKYDLARQEIEKVMNLFPEAVQFRIVAAELCMKSGEEDSAAAYYHEILEIDSTNIFALTNLTDYYRKKEDYRSSIEYLAKSFRSTQIDVKRKLAIMSYYLTDEQYRVKYRKELENLLDVFLEVHPDEPEAWLLAADFYIDGKEFEKAYFELKKYLEKNQGNYPIYMQAVLLANAASLNEEMIQMADRALEVYPDSSDLLFFRGIGYYELGNYKELVDNFRDVSDEGFSTNEYASQSKMLVAEAYYRLGDYVQSDSIFEILIAEDPENYMVLNNYSYYLAERGEKLSEAKQWSLQTILNNPENATFLDTYAWILYRLNNFEEAERYILKALDKGGNTDPEVNEHAGDIQAALSSFEIARSYYNKAILLGGERTRIEKKIEDLGHVQEQ